MLLYKDEYQCWLENAVEDDLHSLLRKMSQEEIEDAFYKNLAFGTGGLRGTIGAGTNRMNVYTVAKASQGLADYLVKKFSRPSVVIRKFLWLILRDEIVSSKPLLRILPRLVHVVAYPVV